MRTYERTHPWITFRFNLGESKPFLWLGLGEAVSKIEHLSRMPLQKSTATSLHQLYLAKGAAATTAIEGNSLSEAEVLAAVQGKLSVPPSKEYLKQEVDNVIAAFNQINAQISADKLPPLTPGLICEYDRMVLNSLPVEEGVVPGKYRLHSVLVGTVYRGAPAEDCEYLMDRLCAWLDGPDFTAPKGLELVYAIIKAIVAHLYLARIHPFGDGNGRTARLVEFYVLMSACVPAPAAHLLSNHYNQTRAEYYRQLNHASKSGGGILPFVEYAVRGLVDGLRAQLEHIWQQNWNAAWQGYVGDLFGEKESVTQVRRRHLAIDLGGNGGWLEIATINQISPFLRNAYANKGPKTIQRDVNTLSKMGLIDREGRQIRARKEIIRSFLPLRKNPVVVVPAPASGQLPLPAQ